MIAFLGSLLSLVASQFGFAAEGIPSGVEGPYTRTVIQLLKSATPSNSKRPSPPFSFSTTDGKVALQCWETPNKPYLIGVKQELTIHAPVARVEAVLDDLDHYAEIFPGFEDIHFLKKDKDVWTTYWEQKIPLFFVPNVKYEMIYWVDKHLADRKTYRYQLKNAGSIVSSDGMVVIESLDPTSTRYTEYDFFEADWGPAKVLGLGRIWRESVEGLILSDLGVAFKAENPGWDSKRILEESKKKLSSDDVKTAIQSRTAFKL